MAFRMISCTYLDMRKKNDKKSSVRIIQEMKQFAVRIKQSPEHLQDSCSLAPLLLIETTVDK